MFLLKVINGSQKKTNSDHWTKERCTILHKISSFILTNFNDDTSDEDKKEWCHLFSNMFGISDEFKIIRTLDGKYHKLSYTINLEIPELEVLFKN